MMSGKVCESLRMSVHSGQYYIINYAKVCENQSKSAKVCQNDVRDAAHPTIACNSRSESLRQSEHRKIGMFTQNDSHTAYFREIS